MKTSFKGLKDLSVAGKRVLLRVDFNVPLDKKGNISDDNRIVLTLPTIKYLVKKKAKIIIMSHLGEPKGFDEKLRMNVVAVHLQKLVKRKVKKLNDCIGNDVERVVGRMKPKDILLLENLRFHPEEEENSPIFAELLACLGDVYINDAFGAMHRAHASVDAITDFLPSAAGLLVEKELAILSKLLTRPKRPFITIMGGVKVSDKIKFIKNIVKKVDALLIGGAMMFTFLKSERKAVGDSLVEDEMLNYADDVLSGTKKIMLPTDVVIAKAAKEHMRTRVVSVDRIPYGFLGLDVGPATIDAFIKKIKSAKTIFWNGPLGLCEIFPFGNGTERIARAIARVRCTKIVSGGDTAAVIDTLKLSKKFSYVSSGGGATLEFLEGKALPGVTALERSYKKFKQEYRR